MADERNVQHLKRVNPEAAAVLTRPKPTTRRGGGHRGHMAIGGETVSHNIVLNLPRKAKKELFRFERRSWWNKP